MLLLKFITANIDVSKLVYILKLAASYAHPLLLSNAFNVLRKLRHLECIYINHIILNDNLLKLLKFIVFGKKNTLSKFD